MQFYALEPFGFDIDDVRMGLLGSIAASAFGAKLTPEDIMLGPSMPSRVVVKTESELLIEQLQRIFPPNHSKSTR